MKKIPLKLTVIVGALLWSLASQASGLNYNYLQLTYVSVDFDDIEVGADGYGVAASALLAEQVYATASVSRVETDEYTITVLGKGTIESDSLSLGLGFRQPLAENTDIHLEAAFLRGKGHYKGDFSVLEDDSDNGYNAGIGIRHLVTEQFELGADVSYQDLFDDSQTSYGVNALLHISSHFSAGLGYTVNDDADMWLAGIRINF